MSTHLYPGPGSAWPAGNRTTKGLRDSRYERVKCPDCGRIVCKNALARHQQTHGQQVKARVPGTYVPQGHRRCGIDGCQRILPREAARCYRHSSRDEDLQELDRLCAMGVTRPRWWM